MIVDATTAEEVCLFVALLITIELRFRSMAARLDAIESRLAGIERAAEMHARTQREDAYLVRSEIADLAANAFKA